MEPDRAVESYTSLVELEAAVILRAAAGWVPVQALKAEQYVDVVYRPSRLRPDGQ
jgi:hypothetical protein